MVTVCSALHPNAPTAVLSVDGKHSLKVSVVATDHKRLHSQSITVIVPFLKILLVHAHVYVYTTLTLTH